MKKLISALALLASTAWPALADDITYGKHIRPVWEDRCERCHGASAPLFEAFMQNSKQYELDDKGPRMDTYERLVYFVSGPDAGALMRRLDDGSNTKDGQPGNMYRHLGRGEQRKENLQLFKQWVGEGAWTVRGAGELTQEEIQRIKAPN